MIVNFVVQFGNREIVFQAKDLVICGPFRVFGFKPLAVGKELDTIFVVLPDFRGELLPESGQFKRVVEVVEDVDFDVGEIEIDERSEEFL